MIDVPISSKAYGVYQKASAIIGCKIGPAAPNPEQLIGHELSLRDPDSVAHEYLDHLREKRRRRLRPNRRVAAS